ncbi:MAG: hypothetical protein NTX56_19575 [Proteobacteria bacterium]|nr:hypothetical protein [Pseudomonadota bacterium]
MQGLKVAALTEFAFVSPLAAVGLGGGGLAATGLGIYNGDITQDNIPEIAAYAVAGLVLHAALSPAQTAAAEATAFSVASQIRLLPGTKVFRVYIPGRSRPDGVYWTTIDPRKVANYGDAAGLPVDIAKAIANGDAKLVVGEIVNGEGIEAASAANSAVTDAASRAAALEGIANRGGLLELRIQNAGSKVRAIEEVPFKQFWRF